MGTIRKWLPEDPATGDPPLWRAVHDDGDEEDLEEHEVKEAVEAYKNPKAVTFLNPGLSSALSSPAMSMAGRADRYAGRAALAPPPAAAAAAPASAKKPKPSPAAEKPRPSPARTTRHTRA